MSNKDKLVNLLKSAKFPLFDEYPTEVGLKISNSAYEYIAKYLEDNNVVVFDQSAIRNVIRKMESLLESESGNISHYFEKEVVNGKVDGCMNILNWYRNLYYKEGLNTEQGIMANAINDMLMRAKSLGVLDKLNEENSEI